MGGYYFTSKNYYYYYLNYFSLVKYEFIGFLINLNYLFLRTAFIFYDNTKQNILFVKNVNDEYKRFKMKMFGVIISICITLYFSLNIFYNGRIKDIFIINDILKK